MESATLPPVAIINLIFIPIYPGLILLSASEERDDLPVFRPYDSPIVRAFIRGAFFTIQFLDSSSVTDANT